MRSKRMAVLVFIFLAVFVFSAAVKVETRGSSGGGATNIMSIAKPHCPEKCGNMSIPYPFGIGKGCYLNSMFEVICNHTSGSASLSYFEKFGYRLFNISLEDHSLHINSPAIVVGCSDVKNKSFEAIYEPDKVFSFSRKHNKLVAVGCNIYAYLTDPGAADNFTSVCASFCHHTTNVVGPAAHYDLSDCSGIGCCQATLSKHLFSFDLHVKALNITPSIHIDDPCSMVFVAQTELSNFSQFNHLNFSDIRRIDLDGLLAVLDWTPAEMLCREAQPRKDYACGPNTRCCDYPHGKGYACQCAQGYQGNPYLPTGCQDIDECLEPKTCGKGARCINTAGSYSCICPPGHHSINDGQGCAPEKTIFISLGIGISGGVLAFIAIGLWLYRKLKKLQKNKTKQSHFKRNGGLLLQQQTSANQGSHTLKTRLFLAEELEKATENFNESRVLGKGGLGTVYKGMLSDGSTVAVKKSNVVDRSQVGQFINEVIILSNINHRNIVKLLGCCLETEVPLLVYEYVSNGTLSHHLHDKEASASLISWKDRLRIAGEVAEALAYLHSYASTAIFHRDIKSSNILLDQNYRAVVSDFGLSRSVSVNQTHLTTSVGGTFGYLDPEYFRSGQLTDKSDVYAFGVVLVELLTGRKAVSSNRADEGLVLKFQSSMKQNRLLEIIETAVANEAQEEEVRAVAVIAKSCLKLNSKKRPSMKEIVSKLDQLRSKEEQHLVHQSSFDSYNWRSESTSYSQTMDLTVENYDTSQDHVMPL